MELSSFPILELLQCLLHRQGGPVRAEAGHRVERVGHPHDPHFERDLFALQSVGEPFAVEPLVMRANDGKRRGHVAHQGARIRAPMTGCSMMCRYSASVSFPALCRTASDTPILPMSCSSAPRATPSITACDSPIWRPIRAE